MKNDANWTLMFPRSSREAFGSSMQEAPHRGDLAVFIAAAFAAGFLLGMWVLT